MNKEEVREFMKEKGFEEISMEEHLKVNVEGEGKFLFTDGALYFKPKQKFPIVFEDDFRKVEVSKNLVMIKDKNKLRNDSTYFDDSSIPLLIQAVEKYKELQK